MAVKKKVTPKKKRKAAPKKKNTRKKSSSKAFLFKEVKKIFFGLAILLSIILTTAMVMDIFFGPDPAKKKSASKSGAPKTVAVKNRADQPAADVPVPILETDASPGAHVKKKVAGLKEKPQKKVITYEVFDDVKPVIEDPPIKPVKDKIPSIAIIIDDIGYDRKMAMALSDLDPNITFSVLPFSPFGKKIAKQLHKKGAELMLHLPMEPVEYPKINPGPGAILSDMPPDVLIAQLKKDILEVPNIKGVNNHMGSKLTAHDDKMNQVFSILKTKNLYFIDSRTAPRSRCRASARLLKVKFAARDVFLDNLQEHKYIKGQLAQLVERAKKHGSAIGIGHPYKATLETLSTELIRLNGKVKIVRASTLVHIPE